MEIKDDSENVFQLVPEIVGEHSQGLENQEMIGSEDEDMDEE
jgi:hypothetical protein